MIESKKKIESIIKRNTNRLREWKKERKKKRKKERKKKRVRVRVKVKVREKMKTLEERKAEEIKLSEICT